MLQRLGRPTARNTSTTRGAATTRLAAGRSSIVRHRIRKVPAWNVVHWQQLFDENALVSGHCMFRHWSAWRVSLGSSDRSGADGQPWSLGRRRVPVATAWPTALHNVPRWALACQKSPSIVRLNLTRARPRDRVNVCNQALFLRQRQAQAVRHV